MSSGKVLTEIYVPALGGSFDIRIPLESRVGDVVKLVSKLVEELSEGRFCGTEDTVLAERESGRILAADRTVSELGIGNGTQLMLF